MVGINCDQFVNCFFDWLNQHSADDYSINDFDDVDTLEEFLQQNVQYVGDNPESYFDVEFSQKGGEEDMSMTLQEELSQIERDLALGEAFPDDFYRVLELSVDHEYE